MRAHRSFPASLRRPFALALAAILFSTGPLLAQKHEVAGSLGAILGNTRTTAGNETLHLDPDDALGLSYDRRLLHPGPVAVYGGIDFVASNLRAVDSANSTLTRDIATIFLTPHLMVKFTALPHITPWVLAGGGLAVYEQSLFRIDGQNNPASRDVTHGAFTYGGGVDVPVWRFVALRGQIKDFYTGSPSYNAVVSGGQHNVVVGGALVFRWGQ